MQRADSADFFVKPKFEKRWNALCISNFHSAELAKNSPKQIAAIVQSSLNFFFRTSLLIFNAPNIYGHCRISSSGRIVAPPTVGSQHMGDEISRGREQRGLYPYRKRPRH